MIVGCYRSDEVQSEHILNKMIRDIKEHINDNTTTTDNATTTSKSLTEIEIGNLSLENVTEMICELLSKDISSNDNTSTKVKSLAEIVFTRTQGNIFHVRTFLTMLVEQGFLQFHVGTFQWDWDIDTIQRETTATDNVVDLIQTSLQKMDPKALRLLKLASCLGNSFDYDTLWLLWKVQNQSSNEGGSALFHEESKEEQNTANENEFELLLELVTQQLCLVTTDTGLRFVHDKVQEAVVSLMQEEEFLELHKKVGIILLNHLTRSELDALIFVIVGLLNSSNVKHSPQIAGLNFRAARKAADIAAFSSAVSFVHHGLQNLEPADEMWSSHFDLTLKLHSLGARAEQCLGNNEEAERLCTIILRQSNLTPLQRGSAHKIRLDMLHNSGNFPEALDLCLKYLAELGCEFPKQKLIRKAQIGPYLRETKAKYIPTIDEIQKMPMISDPVILEILLILEKAGSIAYLSSSLDYYILIRCRCVRYIREHGLFDDAGGALASYAGLMPHFVNIEHLRYAKEVAELSLAVHEILPSNRSKPRALVTTNVFVFSWSMPLKSILPSVMEGYVLGFQIGNTFSACSCSMWYLYAEFAGGINLKIITQDMETYVPQMKRLKQDFLASMVIPVWQLILNLLGYGHNTHLLTGDVMDEENVTVPMRIPFLRIKAIACLVFGEYEAGAKIVADIGGFENDKKKFIGAGFGMHYLAFGVCCYYVARRSSKWGGINKHKRWANEIKARVQSYVVNGCVNLVHVLSILDAEFFVMTGKIGQAKESYGKAIIEAARGGVLQDAAVASERYGDLLLELNDRSGAAHRFGQAMHFYSEWGATRVAEMLAAKHKSLLGPNK